MTKTNREIQEQYYSKNAENYDALHIGDRHGEHDFALHFLVACIERLGVRSILDIGAGTGRTIQHIRMKYPNVEIMGIEPVRELREKAYLKGIPADLIVEGYGEKIPCPDMSYDLVCEFGILHHVPKPEVVVSEMLRVCRKGIFISDSNNFGQGSFPARVIKQVINAFGLWRFYDFVRTKGKMYQISEGDGLFYSYSVFNNYKQIKESCKTIHLLNTKDGETNLYKSASHIALLGIKKDAKIIHDY